MHVSFLHTYGQWVLASIFRVPQVPSCLVRSLVSPKRVVGCRGGSRYVEVWLGFPYLTMNSFLVSWFPRFLFLLVCYFSCFACIDLLVVGSWFQSLLVSWFKSVKVSWFQSSQVPKFQSRRARKPLNALKRYWLHITNYPCDGF